MDLFDTIEAKKSAVHTAKNAISKKANRKARFEYMLLKKKPKYHLKTVSDTKIINDVISNLEECEQVHLMTSAFDSPSIISALNKSQGVDKCVCSTWAITDRGLAVFSELSKTAEIFLLLDKTYSYKWVFASGAIEYLANVNFKFTENHSKIILVKTKTGNHYSFIGSMNLSNNPRLENIIVSKDPEIFNFYEQTIKSQFTD